MLAPPGWAAPGAESAPQRLPVVLLALAVAGVLLVALLLRHARRAGPRPPTAVALRRELRRAARAAPPVAIRARAIDAAGAVATPAAAPPLPPLNPA